MVNPIASIILYSTTLSSVILDPSQVSARTPPRYQKILQNDMESRSNIVLCEVGEDCTVGIAYGQRISWNMTSKNAVEIRPVSSPHQTSPPFSNCLQNLPSRSLRDPWSSDVVVGYNEVPYEITLPPGLLPGVWDVHKDEETILFKVYNSGFYQSGALECRTIAPYYCGYKTLFFGSSSPKLMTHSPSLVSLDDLSCSSALGFFKHTECTRKMVDDDGLMKWYDCYSSADLQGAHASSLAVCSNGDFTAQWCCGGETFGDSCRSDAQERQLQQADLFDGDLVDMSGRGSDSFGAFGGARGDGNELASDSMMSDDVREFLLQLDNGQLANNPNNINRRIPEDAPAVQIRIPDGEVVSSTVSRVDRGDPNPPRSANSSKLFHQCDNSRECKDIDAGLRCFRPPNAERGECIGFMTPLGGEGDLSSLTETQLKKRQETSVITCPEKYECATEASHLPAIGPGGAIEEFKIRIFPVASSCGSSDSASFSSMTSPFRFKEYRCEANLDNPNTCHVTFGIGANDELLAGQGAQPYTICGCSAKDNNDTGTTCSSDVDYDSFVGHIILAQCTANNHCQDSITSKCDSSGRCAGTASLLAESAVSFVHCYRDSTCNLGNVFKSKASQLLRVIPVATTMDCSYEAAKNSALITDEELPCLVENLDGEECSITLNPYKLLGTQRLCGCIGDVDEDSLACNSPEDFQLDMGMVNVSNRECGSAQRPGSPEDDYPDECSPGFICVSGTCMAKTTVPTLVEVWPERGSHQRVVRTIVVTSSETMDIVKPETALLIQEDLDWWYPGINIFFKDKNNGEEEKIKFDFLDAMDSSVVVTNDVLLANVRGANNLEEGLWMWSLQPYSLEDTAKNFFPRPFRPPGTEEPDEGSSPSGMFDMSEEGAAEKPKGETEWFFVSENAGCPMISITGAIDSPSSRVPINGLYQFRDPGTSSKDPFYIQNKGFWAKRKNNQIGIIRWDSLEGREAWMISEVLRENGSGPMSPLRVHVASRERDRRMHDQQLMTPTNLKRDAKPPFAGHWLKLDAPETARLGSTDEESEEYDLIVQCLASINPPPPPRVTQVVSPQYDAHGVPTDGSVTLVFDRPMNYRWLHLDDPQMSGSFIRWEVIKDTQGRQGECERIIDVERAGPLTRAAIQFDATRTRVTFTPVKVEGSEVITHPLCAGVEYAFYYEQGAITGTDGKWANDLSKDLTSFDEVEVMEAKRPTWRFTTYGVPCEVPSFSGFDIAIPEDADVGGAGRSLHRHGTLLSLSCDSDHAPPKGKPTTISLKCSDGIYTQPNYACLRRCNAFPYFGPSYEVVLPDEPVQGESIEVRCSAKAKRTQGPLVFRQTCLSNGRWAALKISCEDQCVDYSAPSSLYLVSGDTSNAPGSTRTLSCSAPKFHLSGSSESVIHCNEEGVWTEGDTICGPSCGQLDLPKEFSSYKEDEGTETLKPLYIPIYCEDSHYPTTAGVAKGDAVLYASCRDGMWQFKRPLDHDSSLTPAVPTICRLGCPVLDVSNGVMVSNQTPERHEREEGSTLKLECDPESLSTANSVGYEYVSCIPSGLNGSRSIWTPYQMRCLSSCKGLPKVSKETHILGHGSEHYPHGFQLRVTCAEGYAPIPNSKRVPRKSTYFFPMSSASDLSDSISLLELPALNSVTGITPFDGIDFEPPSSEDNISSLVCVDGSWLGDVSLECEAQCSSDVPRPITARENIVYQPNWSSTRLGAVVKVRCRYPYISTSLDESIMKYTCQDVEGSGPQWVPQTETDTAKCVRRCDNDSVMKWMANHPNVKFAVDGTAPGSLKTLRRRYDTSLPVPEQVVLNEFITHRQSSGYLDDFDGVLARDSLLMICDEHEFELVCSDSGLLEPRGRLSVVNDPLNSFKLRSGVLEILKDSLYKYGMWYEDPSSLESYCGHPESDKCRNGIKDSGEEGVDCGGPCAAPCNVCHNGVRDPDEEGVDCGGSCSTPCAKMLCAMPTGPPLWKRRGGAGPKASYLENGYIMDGWEIGGLSVDPTGLRTNYDVTALLEVSSETSFQVLPIQGYTSAQLFSDPTALLEDAMVTFKDGSKNPTRVLSLILSCQNGLRPVDHPYRMICHEEHGWLIPDILVNGSSQRDGLKTLDELFPCNYPGHCNLEIIQNTFQQSDATPLPTSLTSGSLIDVICGDKGRVGKLKCSYENELFYQPYGGGPYEPLTSLSHEDCMKHDDYTQTISEAGITFNGAPSAPEKLRPALSLCSKYSSNSFLQRTCDEVDEVLVQLARCLPTTSFVDAFCTNFDCHRLLSERIVSFRNNHARELLGYSDAQVETSFGFRGPAFTHLPPPRHPHELASALLSDTMSYLDSFCKRDGLSRNYCWSEHSEAFERWTEAIWNPNESAAIEQRFGLFSTQRALCDPDHCFFILHSQLVYSEMWPMQLVGALVVQSPDEEKFMQSNLMKLDRGHILMRPRDPLRLLVATNALPKIVCLHRECSEGNATISTTLSRYFRSIHFPDSMDLWFDTKEKVFPCYRDDVCSSVVVKMASTALREVGHIATGLDGYPLTDKPTLVVSELLAILSSTPCHCKKDLFGVPDLEPPQPGLTSEPEATCHCDRSMIGDGRCHPLCDSPACLFDGGDCDVMRMPQGLLARRIGVLLDGEDSVPREELSTPLNALIRGVGELPAGVCSEESASLGSLAGETLAMSFYGEKKNRTPYLPNHQIQLLGCCYGFYSSAISSLISSWSPPTTLYNELQCGLSSNYACHRSTRQPLGVQINIVLNGLIDSDSNLRSALANGIRRCLSLPSQDFVHSLSIDSTDSMALDHRISITVVASSPEDVEVLIRQVEAFSDGNVFESWFSSLALTTNNEEKPRRLASSLLSLEYDASFRTNDLKVVDPVKATLINLRPYSIDDENSFVAPFKPYSDTFGLETHPNHASLTLEARECPGLMPLELEDDIGMALNRDPSGPFPYLVQDVGFFGDLVEVNLMQQSTLPSYKQTSTRRVSCRAGFKPSVLLFNEAASSEQMWSCDKSGQWKLENLILENTAIRNKWSSVVLNSPSISTATRDLIRSITFTEGEGAAQKWAQELNTVVSRAKPEEKALLQSLVIYESQSNRKLNILGTQPPLICRQSCLSILEVYPQLTRAAYNVRVLSTRGDSVEDATEHGALLAVTCSKKLQFHD
eukprot:GHVH01011470.1.p1 GENE.GHVH01011470.1~~GHVH01011470.1.p1  ORF type:complete len:3138 (+),score=398.41 GHVH01011470.1:51-9464(+)